MPDRSPVITWREYRYGDRTLLTVRPEQAQSVSAEGLAQFKDRDNLALTFSMSGKPVLIAGIKRIWAGRAVAWALVSDDIPLRAWGRIFAVGRDVLAAYQSECPRIEAYTPATWFPAVATLNHLGFETEAVMTDFSPDGDYILGVYRG